MGSGEADQGHLPADGFFYCHVHYTGKVYFKILLRTDRVNW